MRERVARAERVGVPTAQLNQLLLWLLQTAGARGAAVLEATIEAVAGAGLEGADARIAAFRLQLQLTAPATAAAEAELKKAKKERERESNRQTRHLQKQRDASLQTMQVTVPHGYQGGMPLQMQMPNGQILMVLIPVGLKVGQSFVMSAPMLH